MACIEGLGVVTCRSGVLIVIDTGYLNLWSHDRPPTMPEGVLDSEEATARANSFVDLRIVGPDVEQVGRLLDMSRHPLYVFDQPPDHPELQSKFEEMIRHHKLDARLERMPQRIPHRKRVDLALDRGSGAGEVQYHGVWAAVVSGVPTNQELRLFAERCSPPEESYWKRVTVACRPQVPVVSSLFVGLTGVDYARLLIGDVDALGFWQHEQSLDGLADYVFWGRDAKRAASALRAPALEPGEFGWLNVPEDIALRHGMDVEKYRDKHHLELAGDFRPHSDHWRIMTPTRKSATESASVQLDGVQICNFMTTWGDGMFEVHRDLGESGELVQIRIELEKGAHKFPLTKNEFYTKIIANIGRQSNL